MNLFADMGVQPATLQSGPRPRPPPPPTPPARPPPSPRRPPARRCRPARPVTISGTATDTGGGVVGGVEVSTDDGATWHPATGRAHLDLHLDAGQRRRDDHDPGPGHRRQRQHRRRRVPVAVTVGAARPARAASGASGVDARRPRPIRTARRHRGRRRSSAPTSPARSPRSASTRAPATPAPTSGTCGRPPARSWPAVTFTGETATGWQQANLSAAGAGRPPNTTYVVSYYAPNGHYAGDDELLRRPGVDNAPLHALRDGAGRRQRRLPLRPAAASRP